MRRRTRLNVALLAPLAVPAVARSANASIDIHGLDRELFELGDALRRNSGAADLRHLRRVERVGRLCEVLGIGSAWVFPNPISILLLAQAMMVRFVIGHQVGHGSYDHIEGVPRRYTSPYFARGWRRFIDWPDWWKYEDWLHTHNQLHHPHTQSVLDADIMDPEFLVRFPKWLRVACLAAMMATWKFTYYAPRMRRECAAKDAGAARIVRYEMRARDLLDVRDREVRILWMRSYVPYIAFRFAMPALIVLPLGSWAVTSVLSNLAVAELCHQAHAFICVRPSHCGADIPLFARPYQARWEFYLQSVLGTVNYRPGGDTNDLLHGWANYQIEHHLWPGATLLQYRLVHPRLVEVCRCNAVPYREGNVLARFRMMAALFMGLTYQETLDTAAFREGR